MRLPFQSSAPAAATRQPRPPFLPEVAGASVGARYCEDRTGGDFYDFALTPNGRLLVLMADIAGKREQTFSIAAAMQDLFHGRGPELFAGTDGNESLALTELALDLNRGIMQAAAGVRLTAAFLACYDNQLGTTWWVNAGHIPGLHIAPNGDTEELPASGIPFGLFSHTPHDSQLLVIQPGASLLLASKGLVEIRHGSREFGIAGVTAAAAVHERKAAKDLCQAVLDASDRFIAETPSRLIPLPGRTSRHPDRSALAIIRTV
jgi:serine phosphatase RsbU (regulator of sigma subunit)